MEQNNGHWKNAFNYKYTGAYEMQPGETKTVTIKSTAKEAVKNTDGREDVCFVAYFTDAPKPMVLNKTNCKTISKLYGPFVENWIGKRITIKSENVKAFGEMVDALRVVSVKPPDATPKDYSLQIRMLKECTTLDDLAKIYKSLTREEQLATVKTKDELKTKLSK